MPFAAGAPAAGLAAPPRLLRQRPGQHLLTSPSRAASARRRASSCRVDMRSDRSFLWSLITQDHATARHHHQRPRSARVAAPSAASPSADSRYAAAARPGRSTTPAA